MEEILKKDIFEDHALLKLSPDYNPSEIILRMQIRRSLVKDTHCHKINKHTNWPRINFMKKHGNNSSKTNKEVIKLKSMFQNKNLRNEINIRKCTAIRSINIKKEKAPSDSAKLFDVEIDDIATFLQEDLDVGESSENIDLNDDYIEHENVRQIDILTNSGCAIADNVTDKTKQDTRIHLKPVPKDNLYNNNKFYKNKDIYNGHDVVGDLQSLLIKMAITSYEGKEEPEPDYYENDINVNEIETDLGKIKLIATPITSKNQIDILNIKPLKIKMKERDQYLAKKYLRKWTVYVKHKIESFSKGREALLNKFFNNLEKRNSENGTDSANRALSKVRDYKTYQHRYKVQKHIIALQKAKLEEQNRTIEELKYNKIIEASRQSVDKMKEEVKKTYYEIDRQLKPKIKCLTNELKLGEFEEPALVLHCLKVPQFLQRMEKRAREREEKHAIIRERRKQMEEERIRQKQQAELAKAEMDKEEKVKILKELKEKRKREKIENIRRKQHVEKMRALKVMADLHYERNLLSRLGLKPWKKLLEIKRRNMEKAKRHYKFNLMKNVFLHWMWYTEDQWLEKNYKAEVLFRKNILYKTFNALKENHYEFILKKQVAQDYYDLYVTQVVFRKFCEGINEIKKENLIKLQKAEGYYKSNLKFKAFTCWRTLPALNALKREQEARKARWREKVLQVVPDYLPPED